MGGVCRGRWGGGEGHEVPWARGRPKLAPGKWESWLLPHLWIWGYGSGSDGHACHFLQRCGWEPFTSGSDLTGPATVTCLSLWSYPSRCLLSAQHCRGQGGPEGNIRALSMSPELRATDQMGPHVVPRSLGPTVGVGDGQWGGQVPCASVPGRTPFAGSVSHDGGYARNQVWKK